MVDHYKLDIKQRRVKYDASFQLLKKLLTVVL